MSENKTLLQKFRCYILQNFPFIEEDFDSLTTYELICKVVEYLNNTITQTNNNTLQVQELAKQFNALKEYVDNYFANLDVQDEINNKLNQMEQDGTLQEIITSYLKVNGLLVFNNVLEMKNAVNLLNGSKAITLGFYNINDGGGSIYNISDINNSPNEMNTIQLNNNLFATLIIDNELSIKKLGAKSNDESFNNHDIIMKAIELSNVIIIPRGKFTTSALSLEGFNNKYIKGNGSVSRWNDNSCLSFNSSGIGIQCSDNFSEIPTWSAKSITIDGLQIEGNKILTTAINCNYDVNILNCWITNCTGDGIVLEGQSYPIKLENVTVRNSGKNGCHIKAPLTTSYSFFNCEFSANEGYGLLIEDGNTSSFINVLCQSNKIGGIKIYRPTKGYTKNIFLSKLTFISCYTENNGLLENSDINYEGNYALLADYENSNNDKLFSNKIDNLSFINCSFNYNIQNAKGAVLNSCINTSNINSSNILDNGYYTNFNNKKWITNYNDITPNYDNSKYTELSVSPLTENSPIFKFSNGFIGDFSQNKNTFFGTINDTELKNHNIENLAQGLIVRNGSILNGINVRLSSPIKTGTLTVKIKYGYLSYNTNNSEIIASYTLEKGQIFLIKNNLFKSYPKANLIIGVYIEKSEDFELENNNLNGISVDLLNIS